MRIEMTTSNINRNFERVSADHVQQAAQYQAAIFADVNGRRGAMHGRIVALQPGMKLAGPAFTVDVRPGDNLMIHAAIALARPGDVLVIDGKGDVTAALMGALMMNACKVRKLAGVVVDGAVRDREELESLRFPVFAVGTNPNGPTKNVAGRIGTLVSCGGVTVSPGDLVVADVDGVVVLEREQVPALLPLAAKKVADEATRMDQIQRGDTSASWLEGALRTAGALAQAERL
jgi:4-hydroxy-4-methyl-2-oxoglutarate aldolase